MSSLNIENDGIASAKAKAAEPIFSSKASHTKHKRKKGDKDGSNITPKHTIRGSTNYNTFKKQLKSATRIWEREAEAARKANEASKQASKK